MSSEALTTSQLMLWAGQQLKPESPQYNSVFTFHFRGGLDTDRFRKAFDQLVSEADNLRTVFFSRGEQILQRVEPHNEGSLETITYDGDASELAEWIAARSRRLMDIRECTFDAVLLQIAADEHVLFLNVHHVVSDAWGISVLYNRLSELYRATPGESFGNVLPSFSDYRAGLSPVTPAAYWQDRGRYQPHALLGRRNLGGVARAPRIKCSLSSIQMKALRAVADLPEVRHWTWNLTLYNILVALVAAFVHHLSGERQLTIGTPSANRGTGSERRNPGLLMEVLPLYGEVRSDDTFLTLLQRQRVQINSFLGGSRPGTVTPDLAASFNVVLNFINAEFGEFSDTIRCDTTYHSPGYGDPGHHLRILAHTIGQNDGLSLEFDLNAAVFPGGMKSSVPARFLHLLDAFLADPGQQLKEVSFLLFDERRRLLEKTTQGVKKSAALPSVLARIAKQIAETPDDKALEDGNCVVTYRQLGELSDRLGERIRRLCPVPGRHVVLHLPRSANLIIAILACWKAGHAYVPLPVGTPADRARYIVSDTGAALLVSAEPHASTLEELGVETIILAGDPVLPASSVPSEADDNRCIVPFLTNSATTSTAYVMYTSGTTGKPKGVVISHLALANYIDHAREAYVTVDRPVFPLFTNVGFDLTVTSLFTPLICGGKLVVYPEPSDEGADLAVLQLMEEDRCDVVKMTPSHLALLQEGNFRNHRLSCLIVGGEELPADLARRISERFPAKTVLINEYGPTEATVGCIIHRYRSTEDTTKVPIGKPIANTSAYVLDEELRLVPPGRIGHLYLGGISMAEGYLNQPELTGAAFLPHPFLPGERLYRSGDLARLNEDSELEFSGRSDRQVKLRGHRIELGEIEQFFTSHPGVTSAAVRLSDRSGPEPDLIACIEVNSSLSVKELRSYLQDYLPAYAIPAYVHTLEKMPLTDSGKIDRRALTKYGGKPKKEESAYVAPSGEIEELLSDIWSDVLHRDRIGVHDKFIDLGGHSLTAIRLSARISEAFDLEVPLHRVFEYPTIASQAVYLEETLIRLLHQDNS